MPLVAQKVAQQVAQQFRRGFEQQGQVAQQVAQQVRRGFEQQGQVAQKVAQHVDTTQKPDTTQHHSMAVSPITIVVGLPCEPSAKPRARDDFSSVRSHTAMTIIVRWPCTLWYSRKLEQRRRQAPTWRLNYVRAKIWHRPQLAQLLTNNSPL